MASDLESLGISKPEIEKLTKAAQNLTRQDLGKLAAGTASLTELSITVKDIKSIQKAIYDKKFTGELAVLDGDQCCCCCCCG